MEVCVLDTAREVSIQVADLIAERARSEPRGVFGLPSGKTPLPVYERIRTLGLALGRCRIAMLDEYVGLDHDDDRSFLRYLHHHVIEPLGIPQGNLLVLDGAASDLDAECRRYDALLDRIGVDLQLLGIGGNGHIAFNEPGSAHDSRTRVVELSEATRLDNSAAFESLDHVPTHALTQGIGTILQAKRIVIAATGAHKAAAVAAMVDGPPTARVPASFLQIHEDVTVVVDSDAGSRLRATESPGRARGSDR